MTRKAALGAAVVALLSGLLVAVGNAPVSQAAVNEDCRPDGLHRTSGVDAPYCQAYDTEGREKLGSGTNRRVIGYFTGWRHGKNNQPAYLVNNIPWTNVTHLNYAFAHVDGQNKISVGAQTANNPATGMEWPGVAGAEMDPALPYKGHFNLLSKYKKQYPDVKTLVSVGGWAETGGYFNEAGDRVDSGGFYSMTTNADNSVNTAGINAFADSTVQFLRTYGFNGVDIDYEYPTSNADAGNPLDFQLANSRRAGLNRSYQVLMKTLREKLDAAAASDGKYYMLTVAAPASGWLLRGMEVSQATKYLDYVNIMSYDLHGAWNKFVGPNASLFDDGKDAELAAAGVYGAAQYGGIGYLNTDWAYHYFRGGVQGGRINIGVPFYSRGHRNVVGGTNGLWGTAVGSSCPQGLTTCGDGARGIDNIWHDKENGKELGAGSNPLWHTKNLERGIAGSYIGQYGLDPATDPEDKLTGTYAPHYNSTLVAPWLWNSEKKVFLSTEDEKSIGAKADYVAGKGIGGIMIWELAGDYAWNAAKGENYIGNTLTTAIKQKFATAGPYGNKKSPQATPAEQLDIKVDFVEFPLGDNNYPISPKMRITNSSTQTVPGGAEIQFDYPTTAPASMAQQSGWTMSIIRSDHTGPNNIGGLKGDFHRVSMKLPSWQSLAPGASADVALTYQLPISGPSNYTVTFGGKTYGIKQDFARGTGGSTNPTTSTTPPPTTTTTTTPPPTCSEAAWDREKVYNASNSVSHAGKKWRAKWWTKGDEPGTTGQWGVWEDLGTC